MTTRRNFLKNASLVTAGMIASPTLFSKGRKKLIGLQLYTVRDAMAKDPAGTLARVAQLGYNSVEAATYTGDQKFYGMDAKAFARLLQQNGLVIPSSHYRLGEEQANGAILKGTVLHEWNRAVDDAAAAGIKYMVCAWLSPAERGSLDHYKFIADKLNRAGEICRKSGIQLCYHNHDFEFEKEKDMYPYDVLLNNTDKGLVKMEADLYWLSKAKQDPAALFKKHPGRFPLWHIKDMDNTPRQAFTEVGNGVIDFKKIFAHANTAGLQYFFVEEDVCPGSPFDSIQQSISYIKKNLPY